MSIHTNLFKTPDSHRENFSIGQFNQLTGTEAAAIRKAVMACLQADYETVYVDASAVKEADLSGINEIIHTHYALQNTKLQMIFVYRKKSVVEKWVETSGLDKFIATAILPAI